MQKSKESKIEFTKFSSGADFVESIRNAANLANQRAKGKQDGSNLEQIISDILKGGEAMGTAGNTVEQTQDEL